MPELAIFCEAYADFEAAATLIERVVESARPWTSGQFDKLCVWVADCNRPYMKWTELKRAFRTLPRRNQRSVWGAGNGEETQARKALHYLRYLELDVDAVVLIRDADRGGRRSAFEAAVNAHPTVVIGVPVEELEAWQIVGFEPQDATEEARLNAVRGRISKDPVADAHTLTPKREAHDTSTKKVLDRLTDGRADRRHACLKDTPLALLHERGGPTGLAAFLDEVEAKIAPLF